MAVSSFVLDWLGLMFLFYAVKAPPSSVPRKVACYHRDDNLSVHNFSIFDIHRERLIHLSQFSGQQEPGANGTEILNCLKYVRPGGGFEPNFLLLEKSEVNGENEIPLYTYIKSRCPPDIDTFFTEQCRIFYKPIRTNDVHYNFEKFLINRGGQPVLRFSHNYPPEGIKKDIYSLLIEDIE